MNVRLFDLKAQHAALDAEFHAAFTRVFRSGQYIMGPEVEAFERAIAEFNGVPYALGISSGTDAILLALMTLGIGPGDEVLCPSFTFFATAGCVARVGARPVFVDSCPVCFNLNLEDAQRKMTVKTKAIIPVHLFGQVTEMGPLLDWARQNNVFVIEDAAQAMGAVGSAGKAGALGDFGTFSFFPTKNLGAMGDAGALITNNPEHYQRAKTLRNHGMDPKYYHAHVGGNFRLDALQAAFLSIKLPHFKSYTIARQRNAAFYAKNLGCLAGVRQASPGDCSCGKPNRGNSESARVILPVAYPQNEHIWNQYTLRIPSREGTGVQREAFRAFLSSRGVATEIYYPLPLHQQDCFRYLLTPPGSLPWAEKLAQEVVSLPVYPELPQEELAFVVQVIGEFLGTA